MSKTGKWRDLKLLMTPAVVTSLPFSALVSALPAHPAGRLARHVRDWRSGRRNRVWYMRKAMPESPRWLEWVGRHEEAEVMLQQIEGEVALQHDR